MQYLNKGRGRFDRQFIIEISWIDSGVGIICFIGLFYDILYLLLL